MSGRKEEAKEEKQNRVLLRRPKWAAGNKEEGAFFPLLGGLGPAQAATGERIGKEREGSFRILSPSVQPTLP